MNKPADALADIDRRLKESHARWDKPDTDPTPRGGGAPSEGGAPRGHALGLALRLSVEIVAGPALGAAIGLGLDYLLGTAPLFLLAFFVLGLVASILNIMRTAREMNDTHKDSG